MYLPVKALIPPLAPLEGLQASATRSAGYLCHQHTGSPEHYAVEGPSSSSLGHQSMALFFQATHPLVESASFSILLVCLCPHPPSSHSCIPYFGTSVLHNKFHFFRAALPRFLCCDTFWWCPL